MKSANKLVTVANKETGKATRIAFGAAQQVVSEGTHHFTKKGTYKRQIKDAWKMLNRPKRDSVFGASSATVQRYKAAKG